MIRLIVCSLPSDETRPICQRCLHGGFTCNGPKSTVFVEATIVKSRRNQKEVNRPAKDFNDFQVPVDAQLVALGRIIDTRLPLNEQDVFVCYARQHLLPNGPIDLQLQDYKYEALRTGDRPGRTETPVFKHAMDSFATVYFGAQHKQTDILVKGFTAHNAALKRLNLVLTQPSCYLRDEVIVSVITLAMLELIVPSGPRNWLRHMRGAERLLELRGPAALVGCSTRSLNLYKGLRHMILFASLRSRTASILARPEWKEVLRIDCPEKELEEQDLHDVLADCSVLIAGSDKLVGETSNGFEEPRLSQNLKEKANDLLSFLNAWKRRWDSNKDNAYNVEFQDYHEQLSPASDWIVESTSEFYIYRFTSDATARMMMLYSTALLLVIDIQLSVASACLRISIDTYMSWKPSHDFGDCHDNVYQSIESGDYHNAKRLAALDVGRSITDYLDHKRRRMDVGFASPVVQWALGTAWKALGGNETIEGRWMMNLLAREEGHAIAVGAWDT